ncbi:translocation/assembly module TamB [Myroides sp. LoEW2-1]|uniref:translocation/assembly module TamB domain-containing protein n=1 Tax=Myroides sp. LoEW2-1 TaxID=2683192 RepID=UPI001325C89A|nr:translocation/assembly module TamB [Myroides sp. LoEW2-1]MVX34785.1 AsmA family protein [Myroides sp. LoEW2-1]
MKKIAIRISKIIGWIVGIIIVLFLLIAIAIQIPYVQNKVKDFAISFVQDKIGTPVSLDRIEIAFPKKVVVKGLYLESQQQDTLLYTKYLGVDISLFKLLKNTVEVSNVELDGLKTTVKRDSLQQFNFDYIIDAFASEEEKEEPESTPMDIAIGQIELNDITVKFEDQYEGHHLDFHLNSFVTRFKEFDLELMKFGIPKVGIDGVFVNYEKEPSKTIKDPNAMVEATIENPIEEALPQIDLGQIVFSNFDIKYKDADSKLQAAILLNEFQAVFNTIDLNEQNIDIKNISLDDFTATVRMLEDKSKNTIESQSSTAAVAQEGEVEVEVEVSAAMPWKLAVKDIALKAINVSFDNDNEKILTKGLDVNHLAVADLDFKLKDFLFSENNISGNLERFSFKEKSGFELSKFQTYFLYSEQSTLVKDFELKTGHSSVKSSIVLNYLDVSKLQEQLGDISVDAVISDSYFGLADVELLMPDILKQADVSHLKNETIKFSAKAKGKVADLDIERFNIKALKTTYLDVSGKVRGLPDFDKAYVNLQIKDVLTSSRDIHAVAPKNIIPNNIEIPSSMSLKGFVRGSMKEIQSHVDLKTSLGAIAMDVDFDQRKKGKEKYKLDFGIKELEVGRLIKNDSIGAISLYAKVDGNSFDPELIQANAVFEIEKAEVNNYKYNHIRLDASVDKGKYVVASKNEDPNLNFVLDASGVWTGKSLSLDLLADIKNVDFYQLKLDEEQRNLSTVIDVKMENILPDSLVGKMQIRDFGFDLAKRKYRLKPIDLIAEAKPNYRKLSLTSQILDFSLEGDYQLTTLSDALTTSLESYFKRSEEDEEVENAKVAKPQFFSYDLKVKYDNVYKDMLPDLKELEPIHIFGRYDEKTDFISLKGGISNLEYGENKIEGINWIIEPKQDALTYSFGVNSISNASVRLRRLNLHGAAYNNILTYDFNLKDREGRDCYVIAGNLEAKNNALIMKLEQDGFMLDYDLWKVNSENRVVLDKDGVYVKDFSLEYKNSGIYIASQEAEANSPLNLTFKNFSIETLTKLVKKDKLLASGFIDGSLDLTELSTDFRFVSDINIRELHAFEILLGNLYVGVKNESLSTYLAKVVLEGGPNRVEVKGIADVEQEDLKLKVLVDKLQMSAFERFTTGMLSEAEGYFSGDINVTGKFTEPKVLGNFKFNDIGFHLDQLNADFRKINETISFTEKGIELDKFSITDVDGNLLVVSGAVLTKSYQDFAFDLGIKAVDFKAINSTSKDNDMFYGALIFDSDIRIKGNMDKPIVNGKIEVGKKTNFTVIMPQEDPSIADREGIVEFIDQESLQAAELKKLQDEFNSSQIKGLDVALAIKVNKEATFTMIMDKQSGDKLILKGEGEIMGGIDPSGKISLTGRYEFNEGSYDLSFNMIKRKFEVQKGSSIVFAGEPTDAILNLTAIYEANTAPIDLLQNQLSTLSPTQQNQYKQKIPFQALLKMKGELLEPEISFDIQLKEGVTSVSGEVLSNTKNKLTQLRANESEMNKQVFALLLLNRFIGENPFESSAGGMTAGTIARQSVNRLLSDQLNNLAGSLIKGVELNFNLESSEDFSSGSRENRTDLNIAVSKRLFSDRLKVTVGSSFEVEGNQRQNEQASNIAGDIELEYTLSKDGRYLMRVYRKNQYEVALQGQIVETGVGFIITMSYERFKELFERSKDKRELKRQLRDESKQE